VFAFSDNIVCAGLGATPRQKQDAEELLRFLNRSSLINYFINSVFDYITLLGLDYEEIFKCQCAARGKCLDFKTLTGIYDNACNWLHSIMLRYPALLRHITPVIDALHYSSHKNCSPTYNSKLCQALKGLNVAINEQKNRLMNYMKTSVAGMGQIRVMVKVRYHLAMLNLAQTKVNDLRQANSAVSWQPVCNYSVVFDGNRIGFPMRYCFMDRPYEDAFETLSYSGIGVLPSHLFDGAELDTCLMIPQPKLRDVLCSLTDGKKIKQAEWKQFKDWMRLSRSCLMPFINVLLSDELIALDIAKSANIRLLKHWASGAPEVKLVPPRLFDVVREVAQTGLLSATASHEITNHSDCLYCLLKEGQNKEHMKSLLLVCLERASNCLKAKGGQGKMSGRQLETAGGATRAWKNVFIDGFDEMVRTGTYAPHHPVIRQLPDFRQDYLAEVSKKRSRVVAKEDRTRVLDELRKQAEITGMGCNKYKTKHRALTPGLFTVFCGGCGICEAFEMMPDAESPLTAFRMFAHRAWVTQEHNAYTTWKRIGVWDDPVECVFT
jgi:hypothetical protein